jgi:RHS repeat-associated protein
MITHLPQTAEDSLNALWRVYLNTRTADQTGTTEDPKLVIEHTSNQAPSAPSSLLTEGETNPSGISDNTPEFSAIYNDPNSGDLAVKYRIEVDDNSDFSSVYWDSGTTTMATTTEGTRSPDITYGGSALASSTVYYWRIAFTDDDDADGTWSTVTSTFSLSSGAGSAVMYYLHTDHLGSVSAITDEAGELTEYFSYYPFGSERIATDAGQTERGYISEIYDAELSLNYLNARYYDGGRGQFMSVDPVFLGLGVDRRTQQLLADPQMANAYSYGRNNPVVYSDPNGEQSGLLEFFLGYQILHPVFFSAYNAVMQTIDRGELESLKYSDANQSEIDQVQQRMDSRAVSYVISGGVSTVAPGPAYIYDYLGVGGDLYRTGYPTKAISSFSNLGGPLEYVSTPSSFRSYSTPQSSSNYTFSPISSYTGGSFAVGGGYAFVHSGGGSLTSIQNSAIGALAESVGGSFTEAQASAIQNVISSFLGSSN